MSTQAAVRDQFAPVERQIIGPILIVDDHEQTAKAVAAHLMRAGFDSYICHRGNDALNYVSDHRPAAALVDIHLADLSGLVLTSKLREQMGSDFPVIIVSGDTSMETLNSLSMLGATYFLSKPVNVRHLVERLEELLKGAQSNSPAT